MDSTEDSEELGTRDKLRDEVEVIEQIDLAAARKAAWE
jgi:hypothetical protein